MTITPDNTSFSIFVTHVDADGPALRIYGQTDHNNSVTVEKIMGLLTPQFAKGLGALSPHSAALQPNTICCAMFEQGYYRAKILELHPNGTYFVTFIDYGNKKEVKPADIRLLDGISEARELLQVPAQAVEFVLNGVHSLGETWESHQISIISKNLCYNEYPAKITGVAGPRRLINMLVNNQDFGQFLMSQNMAMPGFIEDMQRQQTYGQKSLQQQQQMQLAKQRMQIQEPPQPTRIIRENVPVQYAGMRQNPAPTGQRAYQGNPALESWRSHPGAAPMSAAPAKLPSPPRPIPEPSSFRTRILEIGSRHEVMIPYVEDGPLLFAVQASSTALELKTLMANINSHPPQPLAEPPLIGSVCLGRYSCNKLLLRAVVSKVTEHCCKVHYIDYGYAEVLPYTEIYQLPRQFINPHALAIRFTLSNVSELNMTEEMKKYFEKLVGGGKILTLHVRPSEGSPLIQYGDLYDNGRNVKDILRMEFPDVIATWPGPCRLPQGAREIVIVMYVESCNKFFVQLDTDAPALEALKNYIAEYVKTAPPFKPSQLQTGLHCIALSPTDSQWYRAEITKLSGDTVTVFYVDYGNDETISVTSIRSIRDNNVTKLRAQAIRCILNGYEKECSTEEMDNKLEREILGRRIAMDVVNVIPAGPIVDLYEGEKQLTNILYKLKSTSNGNVGIETYNERRENPAILAINNSRSDEQSNKWSNAPRAAAPPQVPEVHSSTGNSQWNNRKEETIDHRRFDNRGPPNRGGDKEWSTNPSQPQNERSFSRDDGKNDRYAPRDAPRPERNDRFDRSGDSNGNFRGGRDNRDRGGRTDRGIGSGRFAGNNSRSERNGNLDKSLSDKDSDTSSRGSGRHGRRGSSGSRGSGRGRREGGAAGRAPSSRDNDGDSDRNFKSHSQSTGTPRIRDNNKRDSGDRNESKQFDNWANKSAQSSSSSSIKIPPPNITVGAAKNCDLVYMTSPTDFHVQLSPDNLELDTVMASIAAIYETGGKPLQQSMIKQGVDCIAQYSEDSTWYRATVQSVEANGATVLFVDYGNAETVPFDKIKQLEADCAKLPAQALACKLLAACKTSWDSDEIAKFSELADSKNLEAEFVAQENNVYEVLLRELVNNAPAEKYINEEFSDGADLAQAKRTARNKGRTGSVRSQIVVPTDYAPLDAKWTNATITPGSKQNVLVTWFTNPDNFYCQILERKDEFRTMMNDIQRVYAKRQPISEPLQVGSAVMAIFSDDGALYRAEILELNKARGNIVRYVDFGNCAMVEARNTYRVEKRFMTMPKQAVNCCLKNVVPANGSTWSNANKQEVDKFFDADNYECSFHEIKDGKYIVSLSNEGVDVAGAMVDKSIASFAVSGPVAADNNAVDKASQPQVEDLPRFDISLLAGQVLRVKASNVASVNKFHIQLPSATASDQIIDSYMADKDPKVMPRLSCREVCLGAGCLVNTDEGWRRAVVVNCSRTTGFDVRLIDTGANDEIPLDCMLALPGQLSVMQNQAVECSLKNATSSLKVDEKLQERIENKDVIIAVEEVDNNRLIVEIFDTEGNKIKISDDEADAKICPICPMSILSSSHKVAVSHADHSGSVWLKRTSEMDEDGELLGQLFDFYSTQGEKVSTIPGTLCAALSSDGNWYRAKVLQQTAFEVSVHYLDYGNTENLDFSALKALDSQFHKQPQLAVEVALTVTLAGSKENQQEILKEHIVDKEFTATFFNVHKKWIAELTNDEGKISEKLKSLNAVQVSKNQAILQTEIPEMVVGGRYKVACTHADTPAQFWLQREEEIPLIDLLQEKLQIDAPGYPAIEGIPEENTQCVALYSVDEQWYRAEVIDADEDITTIRFVDYGNTDVVDTNMGKIKQIPDSLKATKTYAIKCRLDVIPYGTEDWSTVACEWFVTVATTVENVEALVIADSSPKRVELFFDGKSAVDELVERNYATKIHTEEDLIYEVVEREVDPRAAYVCHAISPSEFWIQQEQFVGDLEVLVDRFIVAHMFPKIDEIKEGMLCVAKFPEDESWYRARVVSHADAGTEVIYIDYGNSAVSTEIREIPEDLAALPPYSKRCCLALSEGIEQWSEEAEIEFVKIAAEGATVFRLDVIEEKEDTSIVKLTLGDEDIVDRLTKLCATCVPVIEERLPPLGEENSPNVLVSHINSPAEFWTQAESAIVELEVMADRLVAAESFLPLDNIAEGTICAAKFPEDDQWYRAKVLSHGDAGTEVLYIDYGNSAITTELRVLPEDIVNIPAMSMCCSLRMPDDVESWSKEACEKFFELVADGATLFQYKILDDKEQTYISLTLEGEDIVEILSPLCAKKTQLQAEKTTTTESEKIHGHVHDVVDNIVDSVTAQEQTIVVNGHQTSSFNETTSEEQTLSNSTSGVGITNAEFTESASTTSSFSKLESSSGSCTVVTSQSTTSQAGVTTTSVASVVEIVDSSSEENVLDAPIASSKELHAEAVDDSQNCEPLRMPKTPITNKILPGSVSRGLSEEEIIISQVERRNSVPLDDKIVPGSVNKGNDLALENSELAENGKQRELKETTFAGLKNQDSLSPTPTRKLSIDEKILPGSLSRGESPVGEPVCPSTPKTPHSEKLVAGVVNLQEKLKDLDQDETLSIVVEENIPK